MLPAFARVNMHIDMSMRMYTRMSIHVYAEQALVQQPAQPTEPLTEQQPDSDMMNGSAPYIAAHVVQQPTQPKARRAEEAAAKKAEEAAAKKAEEAAEKKAEEAAEKQAEEAAAKKAEEAAAKKAEEAAAKKAAETTKEVARWEIDEEELTLIDSCEFEV